MRYRVGDQKASDIPLNGRLPFDTDHIFFTSIYFGDNPVICYSIQCCIVLPLLAQLRRPQQQSAEIQAQAATAIATKVGASSAGYMSIPSETGTTGDGDGDGGNGDGDDGGDGSDGQGDGEDGSN